MNYLILQGVDSSKLSFKGYGKILLMNVNSLVSKEKHAKNRRIDFNITNISFQIISENSSVISPKDKLVLNDILLILKSEEI